jgi:hypothetical protein
MSLGNGKGKERGILKAGWLTGESIFPLLGASYVGKGDSLTWTLSVNLASSGDLRVNGLPDGYNCILLEGDQSTGLRKGGMNLSAGEHEITLLLEPVSGKPKKIRALANYPNPFNPETWIPYRLAESSDVLLVIRDASGKEVRRFHLGNQSAGEYVDKARAIHWDGRNEAGEQVGSGVYFYSLQAGDATHTGKMVIVR